MAKRNAGRTKVRTSSLARGSRARRGEGADGVREARGLPALESLAHVPAFGDCTPTEAQRTAFAAFTAACGQDPELELGFVCRLDRNFPAVRTERALERAEHAERIFKGDLERPAVGDWVVLRRPAVHDVALIEQVLPRKQALTRWRGSRRGEFQVLAANVDEVLVAQPVGGRGLSLDRIARSAVVASDSGAAVSVLLTKADRTLSAAELARDVASVRALLGEDARVCVLASLDGATAEEADLASLEEATLEAGGTFGLDAVREVVAPGVVGLVLGESGAGKSTLLNALLGESVLDTTAVRAADDAGRHTTVARRMVKIPGAGVIIDCPGLRSLPLVGHGQGLQEVFGEVAELAGECRFRDCTHTGEPGCRIAEALSAGELSDVRTRAYLELAGEMRRHAGSLDPDVTLAP